MSIQKSWNDIIDPLFVIPVQIPVPVPSPVPAGKKDPVLISRYKELLSNCFRRLVEDKRANYAFVGQIHPQTQDIEDIFAYADRKGDRNSNIFSVTKTLCGNEIVLLYLNGLVDIIEDASKYVGILGLDPALYKGPGIIDYCNHTSGLLSGFVEDAPGKVGIKDAFNIYLDVDKCTKSVMERGTRGVPQEWQNRRFNYDNYGSWMAAALTETAIRTRQLCNDPKHFETHPDSIFFLRDACILHFMPWAQGGAPVVWRLCGGDTVYKHTVGFSGVHMSGADMKQYAYNMYVNYNPLLQFIYGAKAFTRPDGTTVTNNRTVEANDHNVTPGSKSRLEYRYYGGSWLLDIQGRRCVCAIGMLGQMIMIDIDTGVIAIRKHIIDIRDAKSPTNQHAAFFIHAEAFYRAWRRMDDITCKEDGAVIMGDFVSVLNKYNV